VFMQVDSFEFRRASLGTHTAFGLGGSTELQNFVVGVEGDLL
jgi:hypothetical protein